MQGEYSNIITLKETIEEIETHLETFHYPSVIIKSKEVNKRNLIRCGYGTKRLVCKGIRPHLKFSPNLLSLRTTFEDLPFYFCQSLKHLDITIHRDNYLIGSAISGLLELSSLILRGKGSIVYQHGSFDRLAQLKVYVKIVNGELLVEDLPCMYFSVLSLPKGYQKLALAEEEFISFNM
jgi:hypothetical protein